MPTPRRRPRWPGCAGGRQPGPRRGVLRPRPETRSVLSPPVEQSVGRRQGFPDIAVARPLGARDRAQGIRHRDRPCRSAAFESHRRRRVVHREPAAQPGGFEGPLRVVRAVAGGETEAVDAVGHGAGVDPELGAGDAVADLEAATALPFDLEAVAATDPCSGRGPPSSPCGNLRGSTSCPWSRLRSWPRSRRSP